jgi:hypothetical protein
VIEMTTVLHGLFTQAYKYLKAAMAPSSGAELARQLYGKCGDFTVRVACAHKVIS